MSVRFTVLASGSAGNASLLELDGFGLLLDAGLGPRQLAARAALVDGSWQHVDAVLLTHAHADHWNERTFKHLLRRQIPVYCHGDHVRTFQTISPAFAALQAARLVRTYRADGDMRMTQRFRCRPLPLCHDGGATFGFRFDGPGDLFSRPWSVAYVADLGSWDCRLAQALANVELLAVEFNHDVAMESTSGRTRQLIDRVLGDHGHLSNNQAARLLNDVLRRSAPGRLRHVVQLHLSLECNRPSLAAGAARAVLDELGSSAQVHTTHQHKPSKVFRLGGPLRAEAALAEVR